MEKKFLGRNFGKIIVIDLDGVILKFNGGFKPNVFGEAINGAKKTLDWLNDNDWYVCIYTTRIITKELVLHLAGNGILYDDINGRCYENCVIQCQSYSSEYVDYSKIGKNKYWKHNPDNTSSKPIASVYVDDMDWRQKGKNFTWWTWAKLRLNLIRRTDIK